jgi:DNA-binding PadR family transcriptional regulator
MVPRQEGYPVFTYPNQPDTEGRQGGRHHHPDLGPSGNPGHPGPPPAFGPPFGPGGWHGAHGRRFPGRGRAPRGDLRAAVLLLLDEAPMHGYQLMQAIAERSGGRWTPSPGAVYPAISQLEDEGLVIVAAEGGRKVASLTDEGKAYVAENRDRWPSPFGDVGEDRSEPNLRALVMQLHEATRQVARAGTPSQVAAAATILAEARRALYLLLADGPQDSAG